MSVVGCPMCGAAFDASVHNACAACPMSGHCTLACCPECGYTTVDVERSAPARLLNRLLAAPRRTKRLAPESILGVRPGESVDVTAFAQAMTPEQVALLRTYGIDLGRAVTVMQHRPMTVIQVDHTEVALESELAALILVHAQAARPRPATPTFDA